MLQNREGQKVPSVTFRTRQDGDWVDITSDQLFASTFASCGVDDIVCLSVNDAFVMAEWAKDQSADNVAFIPDGNGEFTEGMGLLVDKSDLGFGKRSWRYSMLVKDGTIEKMFIEPEEPGDPFKVSDADTMLNYINPDAIKPNRVFMFAKEGCPFCAKAKAMLDERKMSYESVYVGRDVSLNALKAATGAVTVPQVFIDGELIGGSEELATHFGVA
jgi:glutathione-dependent peroxiredoxin